MLNDVLVIEDNPSDIREVTRILQDLGVQNIHTVARISSAVDYLHRLMHEHYRGGSAGA